MNESSPAHFLDARNLYFLHTLFVVTQPAPTLCQHTKRHILGSIQDTHWVASEGHKLNKFSLLCNHWYRFAWKLTCERSESSFSSSSSVASLPRTLLARIISSVLNTALIFARNPQETVTSDGKSHLGDELGIDSAESQAPAASHFYY